MAKKYKKTKQQSMVSIIVLCYNAVDHTRRCVSSILKNTCYPYELVLVNNGSTDETEEYLKELYIHFEMSRLDGEAKLYCKDIKLLDPGENLGFSGGNNYAAEHAKGQFLCFMNNDLVVGPKWLSSMMRYFIIKKKLAAVGPMANNVSGYQNVKPQHSINTDEEVDEVAKVFLANNQGLKLVPRLVGFCLIMRKHVFHRIGGWDERYTIGNFEDNDISAAMLEAGYQMGTIGNVWMWHFGSATFRENKIDHRNTMEENKQKFIEKWEGLVDPNSGLIGDSKMPQPSGHLELDHPMIFLNEQVQPEINPDPAVSLLMLAYNRERYFEKSFKSVLDLDYPNFNITLVDNATDEFDVQNKVETMLKDSGRDIKINLIRSDESEYLYLITNTFWREARTEFVAKVDSDTIVPQDFLRRTIDLYNTSFQEFGVIAGFHFIEDDTVFIPDEAYGEFTVKDYGIVKFLQQPYVGGCAYIARTAILARFGLLGPEEGAGKLGGWTTYQRDMSRAGLLVGYYDPMSMRVEHLGDPRHPDSLEPTEYLDYLKQVQANRGFTDIEQVNQWYTKDAAYLLGTDWKSKISKGEYR